MISINEFMQENSLPPKVLRALIDRMFDGEDAVFEKGCEANIDAADRVRTRQRPVHSAAPISGMLPT